MIRIKISLVAVFIIMLSYKGIAQIDSHYWTAQYGAKGLLLNGAVIASTDEENAIFYNPGAMGHVEKFGISLSFLTPQFSELKISNFFGDGQTVTDRDYGFAPDFAAVGFPLFGDSRFKGGIASFNRYSSNIDLENRMIDDLPGSENRLSIQRLDFERNVSQRWIGFGMSFKAQENLSIGLSHFFIIHSESSDIFIQNQVVRKRDANVLISGIGVKEKYQMSAYGGMITKLGLSWRSPLQDLMIGATVTSSAYGFFVETGKYQSDELLKFESDPVLINSTGTRDEKANYKSPISIGLGAEYGLNDWTISGSAEYFSAIPTYDMIDAIGVSNAGTDQRILISTSSESVLNVAVGLQRNIDENTTLFLGARTDISPKKKYNGITSFDILDTGPSMTHVSIGSLFTILDNKISIGLDYGFGQRSEDVETINFEDVDNLSLPASSVNRRVTSKLQSLTLIATYDFIFKLYE